MNIGLLPYVDHPNLTEVQYSNGESFHSSLIGLYLVNVELPSGEYEVFTSYLNLISAFCEVSSFTINTMKSVEIHIFYSPVFRL